MATDQQHPTSLSIHSLTQCVDRLRHTVSYLQDSIKTCEQLSDKCVHPRIRVQQEYEWLSEDQIQGYRQKWMDMMNPFIALLERDLENDIQLCEKKLATLNQQIDEHEASRMHEEKQRRDQLVVRRNECTEKRRFLEAEYKRLTSQ